MKQRIICKGLAVAVILLFLGLAIQPSIAVQSDTSVSDDKNQVQPPITGKPDLTIVDIVDEYYVEGPTFKCVIQNIGSAPSADYELQVDGYIILGLLHVYNSYNHGFPLINAGETKYVECGCPSPFIGILRLRCYVSTSTSEENYNNNRFAHSYFIVNLEPFWFFKELSW